MKKRGGQEIILFVSSANDSRNPQVCRPFGTHFLISSSPGSMQLHSHFVELLLDVRKVLNELIPSGLHLPSGNRVVSAGVWREDLLEVVNLAAKRGTTHSELVLLKFEL